MTWGIPSVNFPCGATYEIPHVNHQVDFNRRWCNRLLADPVWLATTSAMHRYFPWLCVKTACAAAELSPGRKIWGVGLGRQIRYARNVVLEILRLIFGKIFEDHYHL